VRRKSPGASDELATQIVDAGADGRRALPLGGIDMTVRRNAFGRQKGRSGPAQASCCIDFAGVENLSVDVLPMEAGDRRERLIAICEFEKSVTLASPARDVARNADRISVNNPLVGVDAANLRQHQRPLLLARKTSAGRNQWQTFARGIVPPPHQSGHPADC